MFTPSCLTNWGFLFEARQSGGFETPNKKHADGGRRRAWGLFDAGFSVSAEDAPHRPFRATTGAREGGRTWPERMEVEATGRW